MSKLKEIVNELYEYLNNTLKNVLGYPEEYHVEIEIDDGNAMLILTSNLGYSTISELGFTDDPEGIKMMFEERLGQFLHRMLKIKKIKNIHYEPESIIINFKMK